MPTSTSIATTDRDGPAESGGLPGEADVRPSGSVGRSARCAAFTRLPRSVTVPLAIYGASRLLVLAAMQWAGNLSSGSPGIGEVAKRWDGGWYLQVARLGYPSELVEQNGKLVQSNHAFLPLYPLLLRLFDFLLPGGPVLAGMAVAMVAGGFAAILVWRIGNHFGGPDVGNKATALFCFFPGSFALTWVYSEGPMLALSLACVLYLLRRQLWIAAAFSAVASASRPNAAPIALAVGLVALGMWWQNRRRWQVLLAPVLAISGLLLFYLFLWIRTGVPLLWFKLEREAWGEGRPGIRTLEILRTIDNARQFSNVITGVWVAVAAVLVLATVASRFPAWLKLTTVLIIALALTANIAPASPRLQFAAAPAFVAVALRTKSRTSFEVVGLTFVVLLVLAVLSYGTGLEPPFRMWAP